MCPASFADCGCYFRAAVHNQVDVISFLIGEGINVNFADHISGATPLIAAILNGSSEAIEALYENGSDLTR